jgi:glycosyltransferase involved in cell wall biosynthesis
MDKWGEDFSPGSVWVGYLKHHRHETKKSEFARRAIIAAGKHPIALQSNGNLGYDELRKLYNSCSIWISPTESEGFHNVPAEAALCGCHIVCGTTERNGMGDYADDRTADRFSDFDEAVRWLVKPNFEKRNQMRAAVEAIGSREKNMAKFAELLGE